MRKKYIFPFCVGLAFLTCVLFEDRVEETAARLEMVIQTSRSLDYSKYHWNNEKGFELVSMRLYSYQDKGTRRTCREYAPKSTESAVLVSYMVEGLDSRGNSVYQRRIDSEGEHEAYLVYTYDEEDRILERARYVEDNLALLWKYHYYDNGMTGVLECLPDEENAGKQVGKALFDREGYIVLYQPDIVSDTEGDQRTMVLGKDGREDLICSGGRFYAYRWYGSGMGGWNICMEVTYSEEEEEYHCTCTDYQYDQFGRLTAEYEYELKPEKILASEVITCDRVRNGDYSSRLILEFDRKGQLTCISSVDFTVEDGIARRTYLYDVYIQEDGLFELETY